MREQKVQVSASIPEELWKQVKEMADKEDRTISNMVHILLVVGVNEKTRRKKTKNNGLQPG